MRPRTAAALALGLALSLAVSMPVRAGGTRALRDAIEVQSGSCLSRDALVRAVAAWRGTDHVDEGVRVVVSEGPGTRARFVVHRGERVAGEREIRADSATCGELADALALLIAVALDAGEGAAPSGADDDHDPASESAGTSAGAGTGESANVSEPARLEGASEIARAGAPQAASSGAARGRSSGAARGREGRALTMPSGFGRAAGEETARSRLAFEGLAGGGAGFDLVPARVALVNAGLGVRIGPQEGLSAVLRGSILATTTGLFSLGDGQVEARLVVGRLDACALWMAGRAGLEACAGFGGGGMWARGLGFDADKEAAAPWMGAAGRVAGRLTLAGPLWMLAGVEGLVPVLVPRVEVRSIQGQPVADVSVPSVGLGLFLGLGVTFP